MAAEPQVGVVEPEEVAPSAPARAGASIALSSAKVMAARPCPRGGFRSLVHVQKG